MSIRTWIGAGSIALGAMVALGCDDDEVTITGPTVGSIVLQLEADTLSVGGTTQLQATVLSVDGDTLTGETVAFTSSNEDIITVSNIGLVTAVGRGTATVTARADDSSATVTVFVRRAASIAVAPGDTTLLLEDTLRLTVTVLDADGARIFTPLLSFSNSNFAVVIGNLFDGFTAVGRGNAVITVETEGLTAQANITVVQPVGAVILLPDSLTLAVGDSSQLTVIVQDTAGAVIADPRVTRVVFNCDCPFEFFNIASVDSTGLVIGISPGSVKFFARSRGVFSDTTYVTVQ
jgi:uncharacterized protein YjdB